MVFLVKDFSTREELEEAVRSLLGDDISANRAGEHSIEGTADELTEFRLDAGRTIFGVKVVVTDSPKFKISKLGIVERVEKVDKSEKP